MSNNQLRDFESLIIFQCPQERGGLMQCTDRSSCPFGHEDLYPFPSYPLPRFACPAYIVGQCKSEPLYIGGLTRCAMGLHLSIKQVLQEFEKDEAVWAKSLKKKKQPAHCGICRDHFPDILDRPFALLPKCGHLFCQTCLIPWLERCNGCPFCSTSASGVVWVSPSKLLCSNLKSDLKVCTIPPYICTAFLLARCETDSKCCPCGVHPTKEQLPFLDDLDPDNRQASMCSICRESVLNIHGYRLGLLKDCSHVFCSECIVTWLKDNKNCPYCRTPVTQMLIQPGPTVPTGQAKADLFAEQAQCIALMQTRSRIRPTSPVPVTERELRHMPPLRRFLPMYIPLDARRDVPSPTHSSSSSSNW